MKFCIFCQHLYTHRVSFKKWEEILSADLRDYINGQKMCLRKIIKQIYQFNLLIELKWQIYVSLLIDINSFLSVIQILLSR